MANRDAEFPLPERTASNPFGAVVEDRISDKMKITTYVEYFHTLHDANLFYPYDPYFDCFMLYHPGLGHPASSHEWEKTVPQLLASKVPIICTGYTEWDMTRDWKWVMERCAGEVDILMEPGENRFRSLRWDLNDWDPQDISCDNWGVWAFRGKRYVSLSMRFSFSYCAMLTRARTDTKPRGGSERNRSCRLVYNCHQHGLFLSCCAVLCSIGSIMKPVRQSDQSGPWFQQIAPAKAAQANSLVVSG